MATTIAELELQIQGNSDNAVKSLSALSETLGRIKNATNGGLGLNAVSNQIGKLGEALSKINADSAEKIKDIAKALEPLQNIGKITLPNFDKFAEGLEKAVTNETIEKSSVFRRR